MGLLGLGIGVGVGYVYGASVGEAALGVVSKSPSENAKAGARLGGRIAMSLALVYVIGRVL
jgi:hypothetical protein